MIPISFGPEVCGRLDAGSSREWLVADGRGGYAMGTVGGLNTRRYHGLLVVAGDTPASRNTALVDLDPVVTLRSGAQVRLGCHEWASGAIDPPGHTLLARFELVDGLPRWRWRIGDVVIERELAMTHGRPCVGVVHRLISGGPVTLRLDAVCTWRSVHGERGSWGPGLTMTPAPDGAVIEGAYRLRGPAWEPAGTWWNGVYHREEAARGLNPSEDLWYAGSFTGTLTNPGDVVEVTADAGEVTAPVPSATEIVAAARERNRAVVAAARPADDLTASLVLAADAFIVTTAIGPDVVAGYPWFGAWSRDTMTSYEGLFLDTARAAEGRDLLRSYAATLSEGMLANTADTGDVRYNTVDATLWFLHAVERHVTRTGDDDLAAELLPALTGVLKAHMSGTRFGIHATADGLLAEGADGEALTWMDARINGVPVTARAGKPVEVNALWVNGLAAVTELCRRLGRDPGELPRLHATARDAYERRFVASGGGLHDVVDGVDGDDPTMRPNQLLAWSLPYAPLAARPDVLDRIAADLLTPIGLRSLSPEAPGYRPYHRGDPAARDGAYHQGTVWPWLIGPYAQARRAAGAHDPNLLTDIAAHLAEYGLQSVSETADGAAPHAGTGCPFQAWSVAQVLRACTGG
jgi:predicted glycogen debranching enzyme